ncbi:MAG: recombination mediator RecR [Deltaproteobacteria bacterium]|nr:recombination mediator RecR [Deltaproteobacteria bacterium]
MAIFAKAIERLIRELSKFPGVGEKTATRLALHILRSSPEDVHSLSESILAVKEKVRLCTVCFNISDSDVCAICYNETRDSKVVCVVEGPQDVAAIEKTGEFRGRYHVLHGVLSPLDGIGPEDLKIESLVERVVAGGVEEVIMATNPKVEGETTALYVAKLLKPFGVKVTRLAQGLPMGGELEYFDEATVSKALEGRRLI